jgi:uncharacterized RDD family membrane protein YckC
MEKDRAQAASPVVAASAPCVECGRVFPVKDMLQYGEYFVCADDKPVFQQKLAEGAFNPTRMDYAGFWIRFWAVFIDGIISAVVMIPVMLLSLGHWGFGSPAASGVAQLISLPVGLIYQVFFLGKFGATPGKMALNIKVVRANGKPIGYGLAFGRYFAYLLSSFTLSIGFLMAAFDKEKRSLHDRICGTRVIRY